MLPTRPSPRRLPRPKGMPVFETSWPEFPRDDGLYVPEDPEDKDRRTSYAASVPNEVLELIASTYRLKSQDNAAGHDDKRPQKFVQFPKLPLELRRIIWRWSLPRSRIVEIFYDPERGCWSCCPPPTGLRVNSESREVALEWYKLSFATQTTPPMIYIDMDIDQLYVGIGNFSPCQFDMAPPEYLFRVLDREEKKTIKHLVIDNRINSYFPDVSDDIEYIPFLGLPNLEMLTVVESEGDGDTIFCHTKEQYGEFQPWSVDTDGLVTPWYLPVRERSSGFEHEVSALWADLEEYMEDKEEFSLLRARIVSQNRLLREER